MPTLNERGARLKSPIVVIGYGNDLRGDDGVGRKTAEALAALNLPGVRCLSIHQLTPELAKTISRADCVVFVDAAANGAAAVELRELVPLDRTAVGTHSADPTTLLAMAKRLFDACPRAWLVTIPVENTAFGETLSPLAQRGLQDAVERIRALAATA